MSGRRLPQTALVWLEAYLTSAAKGRGNAVTSTDLLLALASEHIPIERRVLRACLRELIWRGVPLGCGPRGYYVCVDAEDVRLARAQLTSRIRRLSRRDKRLRDAYADLRQVPLPLGTPSRVDLAVDLLAMEPDDEE